MLGGGSGERRCSGGDTRGGAGWTRNDAAAEMYRDKDGGRRPPPLLEGRGPVSYTHLRAHETDSYL
eukprot:3109816-Pleurochrysis_carterae.AAC.1